MKLVVYLPIALVAFVLYVRYLESHSIFYPSRRILATPADVGLPFEDVSIKTEDAVMIHGWFIPSPQDPLQGGQEVARGEGTVIFLHGNAGNIGDRLGKIQFFHELGVDVLIIDYRGYGKSQGRPTEDGLYRDALAAYDYLCGRRDIDPRRIIAYGASLGGAVAVDLASQRPLSGLIVDSTFPSAADMARRIYPFVPSFLIQTKLDSLTKIRNLKIPKLFIHSKDDEIVPLALGRRLFEAAPAPKEFLEIAGSHNEGYFDSQGKIAEAMIRFLLLRK